MEVRCHITNPHFYQHLDTILDKLSTIYANSTEKYLEIWRSMPSPIRLGIMGTAANIERFINTPYEDIAEYCYDVVHWYRVEIKKSNLAEKSFTLRNPDDLKQFNEFLDRLLMLMQVSPMHFMTYIETCPPSYWDKIDDLRETSFKRQRDSAEFLLCLEKCKKVSFFHSELIDSFMDEEDESFEDINDDF